MNKYRNKKTVHRGIKFDSIAEAEYYDLALWQAEANGWKVKLQERFELMPKFELEGKKYRKIEYIPDFTFYKSGKLVKVVDVKGMQTKDFKIKAKLFCHQYQVPLILAKNIGIRSRKSVFNEVVHHDNRRSDSNANSKPSA